MFSVGEGLQEETPRKKDAKITEFMKFLGHDYQMSTGSIPGVHCITEVLIFATAFEGFLCTKPRLLHIVLFNSCIDLDKGQ